MPRGAVIIGCSIGAVSTTGFPLEIWAPKKDLGRDAVPDDIRDFTIGVIDNHDTETARISPHYLVSIIGDPTGITNSVYIIEI